MLVGFLYFSLSAVGQDSLSETKSQLKPAYRDIGRQAETRGMALPRLVRTEMCESDMILSNYGDESGYGEEEVKGDQDNEIGPKDKTGEGQANVQLIKKEKYKSALDK